MTPPTRCDLLRAYYGGLDVVKTYDKVLRIAVGEMEAITKLTNMTPSCSLRDLLVSLFVLRMSVAKF